MTNENRKRSRSSNPPRPQESSRKRGPNKPTYKGRRLARPASRGRRGGK